MGSSAQKAFREQFLFKHNLRYIELDGKSHCVLISKNQHHSITEIQAKIDLNHLLQTTIQRSLARFQSRSNPTNIELAFCETKWEDLPDISQYLNNMRK